MTLLVTPRSATTPVESSRAEPVHVRVVESTAAASAYTSVRGEDGFRHDPRWLDVLESSMGHRPILLEARRGERVVGVLPLAFVKSLLFGRFLVGLPYVNTGGVLADDDEAAGLLVDRAVELMGELRAKHLELRHESPIDHPALVHRLETKVHSRLSLEASPEEQWDALKSKVRSQVRKAMKVDGFSVHWGREDLLPEFYDVFCRNMRDLGSPPFPRALFRSILRSFADESELCVVRLDGEPAAAALLLHGPTATQVPSASALRRFNATNVNMLMYWHLIARAVERGRRTFDFGRSTIDGGTHRFKKQWGAVDEPATWQYHVREGDPTAMRRESGRFGLAVRVWQRLPVGVTRCVGPWLVRGIP